MCSASGERPPTTGGATNDGSEPPIALSTELGVEAAYRRYHPELLGFAVRALSDRHVAEDLVQDTFAPAWKSADTFDPARVLGAVSGLAPGRARFELISSALSAATKSPDY